MKVLICVDKDDLSEIKSYEMYDEDYSLRKIVSSSSSTSELTDYELKQIIRTAKEAIDKEMGINVHVYLGRSSETDMRTYELQKVEIVDNKHAEYTYEDLIKKK